MEEWEVEGVDGGRLRLRFRLQASGISRSDRKASEIEIMNELYDQLLTAAVVATCGPPHTHVGQKTHHPIILSLVFSISEKYGFRDYSTCSSSMFTNTIIKK